MSIIIGMYGFLTGQIVYSMDEVANMITRNARPGCNRRAMIAGQPMVPTRTDLWYGHRMGTFGDIGAERQGNTMWEVDEPEVWRICLDGSVEEDWARWFNWASVRRVVCPDGGWQTVAEGELRDQAALGGLISRMWDMSISFLSVDRISDPTKREIILAETIESWR